MTLFAGQGDSRKVMTLLWGPPGAHGRRSGPGPRPGLTLEMILDTAIEIADEAGMTALSMRAVGERLGRTAMALYTYIPSKNEMVDLMYDRALAELAAGGEHGPGWRAAVMSWADDLWAFYMRHPWALQVSPTRPVQGPNEYALIESLVRILYRADLAPTPLRGAVGALFQHVRGAAQSVAEARQAATVTGVSDEEWWSTRSALMAEVAPDFAERFPMLTRLGRETPETERTSPYEREPARRNLDLGLTFLLDGIAARIDEPARSADAVHGP